MADAVGDIVPCDIEDPAVIEDTAHDDVGMSNCPHRRSPARLRRSCGTQATACRKCASDRDNPQGSGAFVPFITGIRWYKSN